MEETTLWLKELLFSSIADVAVLSADRFWLTFRGGLTERNVDLL